MIPLGFCQGVTRGSLELPGSEVPAEGQSPQIRSATGQRDKARDNQLHRTLIVIQPKIVVQCADVSRYREARSLHLNDLEHRQRQICVNQDEWLVGPIEHYDLDLQGDVAQLHVSDDVRHLSRLPVQRGACSCGCLRSPQGCQHQLVTIADLATPRTMRPVFDRIPAHCVLAGERISIEHCLNYTPEFALYFGV